jgi:AraC family transcriptional regulator
MKGITELMDLFDHKGDAIVTINMPVLHLCGDFVVRRGWSLGPRILDVNELVFFPQGTETVYRTTDQICILKQSCWVITRKGNEHSYHFGENAATRHLFVQFTEGESFAPGLLGFQGPNSIPSPENGIPTILISHLLRTAHLQRDLNHCNILLSALLSELQHSYTDTVVENNNNSKPKNTIGSLTTSRLHFDIGPSSIFPRIVSEALSYIRTHLTEPITVAEIAAHCQMSHEHLTRTFVRSVGLPPRQVIIQLRLERACHMLRHSNLSIKEIADQIGFSENHYFSRVFKASYGLSATVYRAKYADPRIQHIAPDDLYEAPYPMNNYVHFNY